MHQEPNSRSAAVLAVVAVASDRLMSQFLGLFSGVEFS